MDRCRSAESEGEGGGAQAWVARSLDSGYERINKKLHTGLAHVMELCCLVLTNPPGGVNMNISFVWKYFFDQA